MSLHSPTHVRANIQVALIQRDQLNGTPSPKAERRSRIFMETKSCYLLYKCRTKITLKLGFEEKVTEMFKSSCAALLVSCCYLCGEFVKCREIILKTKQTFLKRRGHPTIVFVRTRETNSRANHILLCNFVTHDVQT